MSDAVTPGGHRASPSQSAGATSAQRTLAYASPAPLPPPSLVAYRLALFCGAAPLAVGTVALLGYLFTRHSGFAGLGFFTVPGGVLLFVLGCAALLYYISTVWRRGERLGQAGRRRSATAATILFLNFPTAALYWYVGIDAVSRHRFVITNASGTAVDSFVITADGKPVELGPIAAGAVVKFSFVPTADGTVTYAARVGGTVQAGELVGYVNRGPFGGEYDFTVGPDGNVRRR